MMINMRRIITDDISGCNFMSIKYESLHFATTCCRWVILLDICIVYIYTLEVLYYQKNPLSNRKKGLLEHLCKAGLCVP